MSRRSASASAVARRSGRRVGAGAALALALALGAASPALAHDYVVDSTPAEGQTLTALPEAWTVTANNPLLVLDGNDRAFAIVVADAEGRYYGDGCVEVEGATMSAPAALGQPGDYTMTFQYVSSDGHTLSETYAFAYEPAGDEPVSEGSTTPPTCGGENGAGSGEDPSAAPAAGEGAAVLGAVAWIGGGVLVAAAVAAIIVLANRRRPAGD